jgi:RNA polymerase sigma-70 factor (ECF subfamily)
MDRGKVQPSFDLGPEVASDDARPRERDRTRDDEANRAMDRYASGDDAAFGALYDALAPRLHAFLIRQLRDRTHAEDVLQQAMLQIHCARASYVTGAEVVPWAFAIARHLVIDAHRRRKTRREVELDDRDGAPERPSMEPRPDETAQARQAAATIARVLATLPEPQRLAFELLKYDGLSLVEAAEVLGASVGAVKVRAHRTYEALRAAIGREG